MSTEIANRRKQRVGTVISDKMDKSIVVNFAWASRHPIYRKARKRMTRFVAHDEHNEATLGDIVLIEETRPLSKTKRWRLVKIVTAVDVAEVQPTELDPEAGALPALQAPEEGEAAVVDGPSAVVDDAAAEPEPAQVVAETELVSAQTATSATGTLAALVAAADPADRGGTPLGEGNRTFEDMVKEVMTPMIREWLDANLPSVVERLVRREVERIARRAEDD